MHEPDGAEYNIFRMRILLRTIFTFEQDGMNRFKHPVIAEDGIWSSIVADKCKYSKKADTKTVLHQIWLRQGYNKKEQRQRGRVIKNSTAGLIDRMEKRG